MQMHVHMGSGAWRPRNRSYRLPPPVSKLFDAAGRVAVPGLAAGALPKMLARLEAAGGAAVAHQRLDGMIEGGLDFGVVVEAAGGAGVAHQRLEGMMEGAVYLGVKLFMFEPLGGQPAGGSDQRAFALQMLHIALARLVAAALIGRFHGH